MAFTFETSGNNTFLVYAIQEEDVLDTMTLGMITNNRIPGMASVLYTQMNRDCFLKYNVTAKVAVKQFFSGVVNKRRLLGVFSSVAAALSAAEEYMIDGSSMLLDAEYIYADVSTCRAEVICLPVIREAGAVDMGQFFKNIMFSTQFDQTENCDYVARIINYLNSTPVFVVGDFLRLLEELQGTGSLSVSSGVQSSLPKQPQSVPRPQANAMARPRQSSPESQANAMAQPQQPVQASQAQAMAQPQQSAPAPKKQEHSAAAGMDFAVPGQGGDGGFAVPGQGSMAGTEKRQRKEQKEVQQPSAEKEMSMLYLLQHYNKENAAAYKAQKEAKKKGGNAVPAANPASVSGAGFAVPGQQASSQPQFQQPPVQVQMQPQIQSRVQQPREQLAPAQSSVQPLQPSVQSFPGSENFGDTVIMGADGYGEDTVVIGEAMAAVSIKPYLHRSSNNERILLDKPVFHIGKERSYVDYCISGNATISRSHADIINRNGKFFIVDNNSTNHTYVNGEMIPSNTEIPLSHGTKIRLSNEDFEFLTF
ncbi:MAG: FHA domain-containing protein [Lachnospiraceae bacterium]|nr:FHA domain-containing protein [Lachnospiraceae bacterium]